MPSSSRSLGGLYKLLAADKISPRRGAVMAHTCTLLLRTLPAIEQELESEEPQIILDLPRPKRDDDISPESAMVNRWADRCTLAATPVEPHGYDGNTSIPEKSK